MNAERLRWYANRLAAMSPAEIGGRLRERGERIAERPRRVRSGFTPALPSSARFDRGFAAPVIASADLPTGDARVALVAAADALLAGRWHVLGADRVDLAAPDWLFDPTSGLRSDGESYTFSIDYRNEARYGSSKQIWELSRHHHLTVLAAAWAATRDDRYADAVANQLTSWWQESPYLSGINWVSGIEVGIRLISWVWVRRLLEGWSGVSALFEDNPLAVQQIYWHQRYLSKFRSRGSSANNHVIAEAAGALAGTCAFAWFAESPTWQRRARALLERELALNTFDSGINRELASDYQALVGELGIVAAVEAATVCPLSDRSLSLLARMLDASAAMVDVDLHAPRQGDGDDGRALLVDAPALNRWQVLLDTGAAAFGPATWWPAAQPTIQGACVAAALRGHRLPASGRLADRPSGFADAGMTLLRTPAGERPEIWCRCDAGPHGFLSIAAHAHADALAVEVRHDGVDILADPGTYCYHGGPSWRDYFRSTLGHNTVELARRDQSESGGPFLWRRHAASRLIEASDGSDGGPQRWVAEHEGYADLDQPAIHRRTVELDPAGDLTILDDIRTAAGATVGLRMAFHLGPAVTATLTGNVADLSWQHDGQSRTAALVLPEELEWSAHTGEESPPRGWYSPGFGGKVPATMLLGSAPDGPTPNRLRTTLVTSLARQWTPGPIDAEVVVR